MNESTESSSVVLLSARLDLPARRRSVEVVRSPLSGCRRTVSQKRGADSENQLNDDTGCEKWKGYWISGQGV